MLYIDPVLLRDSLYVADLDLCQARLHKNILFPWVILIPKFTYDNLATEIMDLTEPDAEKLMKEIRFISNVMRKLLNPTKINIASFGNIVSQLHVHVIARFHDDAAWPNSVWNSRLDPNYDSDIQDQLIALLRTLLPN